MIYDYNKDNAVSPVIGTILLVAMTVILVSILAAVVMPMADILQPYTPIGVRVTDENTTSNGNSVIITLYSGNIGSITNMTVKINGTDAFSDKHNYEIGYIAEWTTNGTQVNGKDANVMVIATINGKQEIIHTENKYFPKI